MAAIIRTFVDLPCHSQTVELDGVVYLLRLTWRDYCESWYLDVETEDGEAVLTGVRVEEGTDLLTCKDRDLGPPGMLLALQAGTVGAVPAVSSVLVTLSGAVATLRPGHTFLDALGNEWTPTATTVSTVAGRVGLFQAMAPGATELASGDVLTPGVPAVAGLVVSAAADATPGAYASVLERTDLGESVLIVYVPEDEL
jgi:hypothetical protein